MLMEDCSFGLKCEDTINSFNTIKGLFFPWLMQISNTDGTYTYGHRGEAYVA